MVLLDAAERKRRAIGVLRVVRASLAARLHEAGVQWEETAHSSVPVPPEAAVDGRTTLSGVAVPRAPAELEALLRNPPARPPQMPESLPASPAGALDALHRGGGGDDVEAAGGGSDGPKGGAGEDAASDTCTHACAGVHTRACTRIGSISLEELPPGGKYRVDKGGTSWYVHLEEGAFRQSTDGRFAFVGPYGADGTPQLGRLAKR